MGDKVIHVDEELHPLIKEYCRRINVRMRDWANEVLKEALDSGFESRGGLAPVKKKDITALTKGNSNEPWSRPPFWEKRNTDDAGDAGKESERVGGQPRKVEGDDSATHSNEPRVAADSRAPDRREHDANRGLRDLGGNTRGIPSPDRPAGEEGLGGQVLGLVPRTSEEVASPQSSRGQDSEYSNVLKLQRDD